MTPTSGTDGARPRDERLDWLRGRLVDAGSVSIVEAVDALGASGMTIRRDLAELEALGEARRVRGGAQALGPSPFRARSPRNARAKVTIAEKVVSLVPATGAIVIDSSSTMACLANLLPSARDLLVVTNGVEAFEALQGRPGIRVVLTGGERDARTSSLVGPVAEATVRSFRFDVAFLSAAAVDVEFGAMEATPEEASIVRAIVERSKQVVLGADGSKLGATAAVTGVAWKSIDLLVTDLPPNSERLSPLGGVVELL